MAAELILTVAAVADSVNVQANTSRVRIDLSITTSQGTWSHDGTTEGYLRLDGATIADLNGKKVDINTTTALYSGEHTVVHAQDGTKTVTVEAGFDMNTDYVDWVYAAQPLELPTIPRSSSLRVPAITLGADNLLTIQAASPVFTHTLTYTLGSASGTVCSGASGGAVVWTPDISLCAQLPHSAAGTGTLTLCTYHDGSEIGRSSYAFTAYVPNHAVPSIDALTLWPHNDDAVLRRWGVYVKGKSRIDYAAQARGAYGAEPVGGTFSCANLTADGISGTTALLPAAGTFTPQMQVVDSRGRHSAIKYVPDITVHDYHVPVISASYARRCDSDGTPNGSGIYIAVYCAAACAAVGGHNALRVQVRNRPSGMDWSDYELLENGVERILYGFSAATSFEIELSATDALGECRSVVYTVPTEEITFMLRDGGSGASFGKYPERNGLDMGWELYMNGKGLHGLPDPAAEGDAVPWRQVNGKFAPHGYGLGAQSGRYCTDPDGAVENGWYALAGAACTTPDGIPGEVGYGHLLVERRENTVFQTIKYLDWVITRRSEDGGATWTPPEWVQPPLHEGVEYRTTQRYLGMPVYVQLKAFGALPNNNTQGLALGAMEHLVDFTVIAHDPVGDVFVRLPDNGNNPLNVTMWLRGGTLYINTNADLSAYTQVYVTCRYTKE